jgi:anti-sigma factor RsiW
MKHVTCKEVEPLLPATAAGALDTDEEQVIKGHLAICPPCTKHLHEFQQAVEQLAFGVPQVDPPATLRVRVLQAIVTTPQPPAPPPAQPFRGGGAAGSRSTRRSSGFGTLYQRFAPAALAACVLLLVGSGIWMGVMAQRMEIADNSLRQQVSLRDLLGQPNAQMTPLKASAVAGGASGGVVMAPGRSQVAVMATHLPALASGRRYQLWFLDHGNTKPIPAALLSTDDSGVVMNVVAVPTDPYRMAGMRITDEPTAGSDSPTGTTWLEGWYR